jgi:hypothetical protein
MIPTARVQRGPSEAARCASTGIVPATPSSLFLSILLEVEELVGDLVGGERVEHGHDPSCEFEV